MTEIASTVAAPMRLSGPQQQPIRDELQVLTELLPLAGARVLDLGCGAAEKSIQLAEQTDVAEIVAAEVDQLQHQKNLARARVPKVSIQSFGAEAIDAPDSSFDIVALFKSLHHVPLEQLDQALGEIRRVLKPGGLVYCSEPVFAGAFNEVIRLFHDEERVRQAAFDALCRVVNAGLFILVEQRFFRNQLRLESFAQFEKGVIQATHTEHKLSPAVYARVRERFEQNRTDSGYVFDIFNRVDLLRR